MNEAGRVTVDQHTLETPVPGLFAIGDATAIPLASGMPLPKAGVFAEGEAKAVARTIAHRASGRGGEQRFDGHGSCFIKIGGGRAGYAAGDFSAAGAGAVSLRGRRRRGETGTSPGSSATGSGTGTERPSAAIR